MAAITVHVEEDGPVDASVDHGLGALNALGATSGVDKLSLPKSHAKLYGTYALRAAMADALAGRTLYVDTDTSDTVWLRLDEPLAVEDQPMWNPSGGPIDRVRLLSWTSKMGTPSFSLPAGAIAMMGTCPGANGGQSIVSERRNEKAQEQLVRLRRKDGAPYEVPPRQFDICQNCYAEGGQYSTSGVQAAQLMRLSWVQQALADGSFADVMDFAVKNADYRLDGDSGWVNVRDDAGKVMKDDDGNNVKEKQPKERNRKKRYFRLHDSGDFFSPEYLLGWCEVARRNPGIKFWAPSRVWASKDFITDLADRIPPNLIVRPSAYYVNAPPPDAKAGYAAGSTVVADGSKHPGEDPFDWDCKAYESKFGPSCRGAIAPDGKQGCRACWEHTDMIINYTLHL